LLQNVDIWSIYPTIRRHVSKYSTLIYTVSDVETSSTDMRHLTMGIRSEKCVVRRFRRCDKVFFTKINNTV
jgi:uncharacterized protein (DUF1810 family)